MADVAHMRFGYLGPAGTHGEVAALTFTRGNSELVPLASHAAVIEAIATRKVDQGIVAFENTMVGCIYETLDALLAEGEVSISGELILQTEQNLVTAPGTTIDQIEILISHPQAAAQCKAFLERTLPRTKLIPSSSTALAVQEAVRTPCAAAIGSQRAADLAGGVVIAANIQDAHDNRMRFLALARQDAEATGHDKTSIVMTTSTADPGSVSRALRELVGHGLDVLHIESRPARTELGSYLLLVEFLGHRRGEGCMEALAAIAANVPLRVLGSYPLATR